MAKEIYDGSGIPKFVFSRNYKKNPRCCNECIHSLLIATRKQQGSDYELKCYCGFDDYYTEISRFDFETKKLEDCPKEDKIRRTRPAVYNGTSYDLSYYDDLM